DGHELAENRRGGAVDAGTGAGLRCANIDVGQPDSYRRHYDDERGRRRALRNVNDGIVGREAELPDTNVISSRDDLEREMAGVVREMPGVRFHQLDTAVRRRRSGILTHDRSAEDERRRSRRG